MKLEPGLIGCTRNPMWLGRAINARQKIGAKDNDSTYSHALIVANSYGDTFEALWKTRFNHLDHYTGEMVLLGRLVGPAKEDIRQAFASVVREHRGQVYPWWRLAFHLVSSVAAKYISSGKFLVCSELTAKYIKLAGIGHVGRWQGWNPDDIADFIKHDDACEVVFEGIWQGVNGCAE